MPLATPPVTFQYYLSNDDTPPSATGFGTLLTSHATNANTVGSWTAIHSTIDHDLYWHFLIFSDLNTTGTSIQGLCNLGISWDAGSTVMTIAENLVCGSAGDATIFGRTYGGFPLYVPRGAALYANVQTNVANDTVRLAVQSWGGPRYPGWPVVQKIEAIGAATASSIGTSVTPGNTGATGTWTQLTASAASTYCGLMAAHACTDTTMTPVNGYATKLGVANGDDRGLYEWATHDTAERIQSSAAYVPVHVGAGQRIDARVSCSGTSDTGVSVVGYGFIPAA